MIIFWCSDAVKLFMKLVPMDVITTYPNLSSIAYPTDLMFDLSSRNLFWASFT
ncbi:hypothetical protein ACE6H2_000615 [Prunus campanulata]